MAIYKCKMCGGALEINQNESVATCEYCGTQQTVSKTDNDVLLNLFNRANNLRLKCEFDKAAQIYEKIIEQDDSDAEAHWGLVLCKYGIEYVEDPKTLQRVPTCHRTSFDAVVTDVDYQAAIDYSDASQQVIYEREARAIDKIQKDILEIVKNEKPFDVFICYKETDESGKRTIDSSIANDIYHQLTLEGFKVFYAAITLEDKLGQEYEPYIFAALNSAKVMLVLGTKVDYFNAVWVKNEWSRFLSLMKGNRSKLLIPCYRDMDSYDLPEEFAHLQSQDMSKIGFINDVVRGIKKVVNIQDVRPAPQDMMSGTANTNVAPLLKRAFMFLEDGEWVKADEFCEQVLNQDPENAMAYLGKLMAEIQVKTQERLKYCTESFGNSYNYQKVLRFGDEQLKTTLAKYIEYINTNNEKTRLNSAYDFAKKRMDAATTEELYKEAAKLFENISDYKNSDALAKECYEKAEEARKDRILSMANSKMNSGVIADCESALKMFESIPGWKDADEKIDDCRKKIKEIKVEQENNWKNAEILAKRKKKVIIIASAITCAIAIFAVAFSSITTNIKRKEMINKFKTVEVGDCISFGFYEQDNNTANGKEEIEWQVLDKKDGKILVVSKYALDGRNCNGNHPGGNDHITWENCELRTWMNKTFLKNAFSKIEQSVIATVNTSTQETNDVYDKVFLLSIEEAKLYFKTDSDRQCEATDYAKTKSTNLYNEKGLSLWWLRTSGRYSGTFARIRTNGTIDEEGYSAGGGNRAVRPAMWIDFGN